MGPAGWRTWLIVLGCLAMAGLPACGDGASPGAEPPGPAVGTGDGREDADVEAESDVDEDAASTSASHEPGPSPTDTVAAYLAAMADHDGSPDLDLYTADSRGRMAGRALGRGQMDNLVRAYGECPGTQAREQGDYAVVEHPGDSGRCSPWFLERGMDGLWRLDFVAMGAAIRFDGRNQWRIADRAALGPYAFAFDE